MRYRAPAAAAMLVEPLDALTIVFHRTSGITHLLTSPAPEVLAALADELLSIDALMARLARDFDLPDADRAALTARVEELAAAGLVSAG